MKVLMTTDALGGVWTYSLDLASALRPHGVEVTLAVMGAPLNAHQRQETAEIPSLTVVESDFRLEWMQNPWSDVEKAGAWLLDCARAVQPDVIHLNGYVHAALPWSSPVMVVAHSCVLSWWRAVKQEHPPAHTARYQREVTRGLNAADLVVAPSHAMLFALREHYSFGTPTRVIHNGRKAGLFQPGLKEPFIFAAGRLWDEGKNLMLLDEAAAHLDWPVRVAGPARSPDGTQVVAGNVYLLGSVPPAAIAHHLARASIYALPARYEPFGLSVLEAALCGCALVLGDIASLRELWDGAALFVSPDDSAACAALIQRLIEDVDLRERCAERALARASVYSVERMANAYLSTYRRLGRPADVLRTGSH